MEFLKCGFELNRDLFYYVIQEGREVDFIFFGEEFIQVLWEFYFGNEKCEFFLLVNVVNEMGIEKMMLVIWERYLVEGIKIGEKSIRVVLFEEWVLW